MYAAAGSQAPLLTKLPVAFFNLHWEWQLCLYQTYTPFLHLQICGLQLVLNMLRSCFVRDQQHNDNFIRALEPVKDRVICMQWALLVMW